MSRLEQIISLALCLIYYYSIYAYAQLKHVWMNYRCVKGDNATLGEFEEVLKAMKLSSLMPLAGRIFDLFDNNRDGTVDMREIICGFSSLKNSKGDDALRLCFQV